MQPVEGACAVAAIWGEKVYLARKGNPLHWVSVKNNVYYASLRHHLPNGAASLRDWQVTTIKVRQPMVGTRATRMTVAAKDVESCVPGLLF